MGTFAPYGVYGDLATLLNYGPNRIYIYDYNATFAISGLIISDFSFSGRADWGFSGGSGGAITEFANKALSTATGIWNMGAAMAGAGGRGVTKPQIKSPWQTVVDWNDSGTLAFNLDLLFVSLNKDGDVRIPVYHLLRCVYPQIGGFGSLVIPPLQYARVPMTSLFKSSGTWGCVGIQIGEWFDAPPVFVVSDARFSMSKEQTPYGAPLYANGSISVTCSHIVGVDNLKEWLKLSDQQTAFTL